MKRTLLLLLVPLLSGSVALGAADAKEMSPPQRVIKVGSKTFTESIILSHIIATMIDHDPMLPDATAQEFGGTGVLWSGIQSGELDIYVEYTGTLARELFHGRDLETEDEVREAVEQLGLRMSEPLGFNNTYAIGGAKDRLAELGLTKLSDLRDRPELTFGFSNEFMSRGDGWPALKAAYGLPQTDVRGMDQRRAYQALVEGGIDVMNFYSTDAEIIKYDLRVLADDIGFFPSYYAVVIYRGELAERYPGVAAAIESLEGAISDERMQMLNKRAIVDGLEESAVAAEYLGFAVDGQSYWRSLLQWTGEHLYMVVVSMVGAVAVGVPLGVWAAKQRALSQAILGAVGIIQTIPSLALLALLMTPLSWLGQEFPWMSDHLGVRGIGAAPAIVALFMYSLLPIVRNTFTGLTTIPNSVRESALALGLPATTRMRRIELPIAMPTILAGIKTAAVINVGYATLGVLIGAGGYGQPIWTGLRRHDFNEVLQGTIPAALLALVVQGLFELAERRLVSRGLRLRPAA